MNKDEAFEILSETIEDWLICELIADAKVESESLKLFVEALSEIHATNITLKEVLKKEAKT